MRLKDKVAVITGSLRGIGRAIAKAYAKEGAKVVIADFVYDEELAKELIEQLKALGGDGIALQADVSKEEDVHTIFKKNSTSFWDCRYFGK